MSTVNASISAIKVALNAQGPAYLVPISDTGSNSNFGVFQRKHRYPFIEKDRFYGVPAENLAFVDRPSILASMEVALTSPSNRCRILALKGLGGMGKTQLMLRYCYLHRAAYEFVFWLEVDSWNTAIASFYKLAINLGFDESIKGKDSENKPIDWVHSWFQSKTKWLLLLNNADGTMSQEVFKLLPRVGGDIILTTRELIPPRMAKVIPVGNMQEEEALLLLFGVSSKDSIEQKSPKLHYAREIVNVLDFMPLAIDLARAYLENTLTSFEEYLSMFKFKDKNERANLLGYSNEDSLSPYKHTVTTVWQLSLERVRAENPLAVQILQACTFFHPENIPVCFFKNSILKLGSPFPSRSTVRKPITRLVKLSFGSRTDKIIENSQDPVREAVAVLLKFSFIKRTYLETEDEEESPANDVLTIHRLVQKVIYDTISDDQRLSWAHNIATALNNDKHFDYSALYAPSSQRIIDIYLFHIRCFVTLLDDISKVPFKSKDLSELLYRVIWWLVRCEAHSSISEFVQSSRLILEATYGKEDMHIVGSLMNHASLHQQWGNYDEAETLLRRAMVITTREKGSEHLNTAHSLDHLASLYKDWGKYREAEKLYKQALPIQEKTLGSEHPDTADSMNKLANLYVNWGKHGKAKPLYIQALAVQEKALGLEHSDTVRTLYNLARLNKMEGMHDEAKSLFKRVLAIHEKTLGSEHHDTVHSMKDLGSLCTRRNDFVKAQEWFLQAAGVIFTTPPIGINSEAETILERFRNKLANDDLKSTVRQLLNSTKYAPSVLFAIGIFCELGLGLPKDFFLALELFTKVAITADNSKVCKLAKSHYENLLNQLNEKGYDLTEQPCGRVHLKDEEYYMCYTCGQKNSCLCLRCFYSTNHDNHDVVMSFACCRGAFCDCGNPDMWKIKLGCNYHIATLLELK